MKRRAFFLFLLTCSLLTAQVKDRRWLLTDSVKYEKVDGATRAFLDSLLSLYHKEKYDTARIDLLLSIAEGIEDDRVWIHYNQLAYDLACKGGNKRTYLIYKANALNNMGYHAQTIGDNKKAIDLYSQSLNLREKIDDKEGIANSLNNLGYVFDDLGDLDKAEEYYNRALKIREQTGEKTGLVNTLNNLGTIAYERKKFKDAEKFYERALKIAKESNFKRGIGSALNNLGNVYSEFGDQKKALEFQEAALKYKEETLDARGLCGTYLNFSNIYDDLKETKKAEEYAQKAFALGEQKGLPESVRDAAWLLFRYHRRAGKFEQALNMHLLYMKMRDSVNNEQVRQASIRQQYKYEYEKKESVLKAEHEKQQALASSESKRQRLFLILVGAVALGVTLVTIVVLRSLRITRKQKMIIERQKQVVEEKQKEILDSIHYAKRIQRSLLTSERYIDKKLKQLN